MTMPDLIGTDPCATCPKCHGYVSSEPICDVDFKECPEWRVYAAQKSLLEALKAGGKHVDCRYAVCNRRCESCIAEVVNVVNGKPCGTLVFIPEAQG